MQKLHRECRPTPRSLDSGLYIITLRNHEDALCFADIPDRLCGIRAAIIMDSLRPEVHFLPAFWRVLFIRECHGHVGREKAQRMKSGASLLENRP